MQKKYSQRFYKNRKNPFSSAEVVSEVIFDLIKPRSVIDVGCGEGEFLNCFKKKGAEEILGIDGDWVTKENLQIPLEYFWTFELEKPFKTEKKYDLAVSLEVAEHLNPKRAESFIEDLTQLAPVVLFSAAIPYQGGTGHKNEQWPEYWAEFFRKKNYLPLDCVRKKIWNNSKVSFVYAQNIILFVSKDFIDKNPTIKKIYEDNKDNPLSLVHPEIYLLKSKICHPIFKLFPQSTPRFIKKGIYKIFKMEKWPKS